MPVDVSGCGFESVSRDIRRPHTIEAVTTKINWSEAGKERSIRETERARRRRGAETGDNIRSASANSASLIRRPRGVVQYCTLMFTHSRTCPFYSRNVSSKATPIRITLICCLLLTIRSTVMAKFYLFRLKRFSTMFLVLNDRQLCTQLLTVFHCVSIVYYNN